MLHEKLKTLRKKNNIKQTNIASYLSITQSMYSKYERGEVVPNADIIKNIAIFYKISIDDLMEHEYVSNSNSFSETFNKLNSENKAYIMKNMRLLLIEQDMGKSSSSQNKESNVG